jgi:hypothetical protein
MDFKADLPKKELVSTCTVCVIDCKAVRLKLNLEGFCYGF